MTSLTLNILLQLAAAAPVQQDYTTAYQQTIESGRPLVVLIGADWCPGCQQMKQNAMPEVRKQGGLDHVTYAYVNSDRQSKLAEKLMHGGSIPQLIMYRKTDQGWQRQQLTGAHSPSAIQAFLGQAHDTSPTADQSVEKLSKRQ